MVQVMNKKDRKKNELELSLQLYILHKRMCQNYMQSRVNRMSQNTTQGTSMLSTANVVLTHVLNVA